MHVPASGPRDLVDPPVLVVGDLSELGEVTAVASCPVVRLRTAAEGLAALHRTREPAASPAVGAVIAGTSLPDLTGPRFLDAVRRIDPDLPLLLAATPDELAGMPDDDVENLFGVLVRPVLPVVLSTSVKAAVRQQRLVTAEQDMLRSTLTAAMDVLVETLALASPLAYRRTSRVRLLMDQVARGLGVQDDWRLHVAAMVSQIGCFAVPGSVLEKVEDTVRLSLHERQMYVGSLALASHLLGQVPRLEEVARWVGCQTIELEQLAPGPAEELPRACFDAISAFLAGYDAGLAPGEIARRLQESGRYPVEVVDAVRQASVVLAPKGSPQRVTIEQLRAGMVLNEDVTTGAGLLLMRRGERVTSVIEQRLRNFAASVGVAEPIAVLVTSRRLSARSRPDRRMVGSARPTPWRATGRTAGRTVKFGPGRTDDQRTSSRSATVPGTDRPQEGE